MIPKFPYSRSALFLKTAVSVTMVSLALGETAPAPAAPRMSDAVTHEQLVVKLRAIEQKDPMRNMKPSNGPDPTKVNRPESLLATSDILCFGGAAVLVPKRAILQIPAGMAERMKLQPGAQFVSWADFYAANRGWITTVEVSRVQAEGNLPLDPIHQERIQKSTNLVVATFLTGPISVLPLKTPVASTLKESKS